MEGNLLKMGTELQHPVKYSLVLNGETVDMNGVLGKKILVKYDGIINCIACSRKTSTSFFQGYCYPCFTTLPDTDTCVLNPETCLAHEGISRDQEWSASHCLVDHIVYLALTSTIKVGVTRETQVPTRWIDQGAWKVIKLARTPNRNLAGRLEVELKQMFTDKTSWQKMLKNIRNEEADLLTAKDKAWEFLSSELNGYCIDDDQITEVNYPGNPVFEKVTSLSLDKTTEISGTLTGIRGQYLILDHTRVINIRKHNGYYVTFSIQP